MNSEVRAVTKTKSTNAKKMGNKIDNFRNGRNVPKYAFKGVIAMSGCSEGGNDIWNLKGIGNCTI